MKIEVWELPELLHMLNAEIYRKTVVKSEQEHTMECERSWEEGYAKGYQDAKNELRDEFKDKFKESAEDLSPAIEIDPITEERLNSHFSVPPRFFGHDFMLYKLSDDENHKAWDFVYRINKKYNNSSKLTYSYKTVSTGIGIGITIICDQHPEEQEDITNYSTW